MKKTLLTTSTLLVLVLLATIVRQEQVLPLSEPATMFFLGSICTGLASLHRRGLHK